MPAGATTAHQRPSTASWLPLVHRCLGIRARRVDLARITREAWTGHTAQRSNVGDELPYLICVQHRAPGRHAACATLVNGVEHVRVTATVPPVIVGEVRREDAGLGVLSMASAAVHAQEEVVPAPDRARVAAVWIRRWIGR